MATANEPTQSSSQQSAGRSQNGGTTAAQTDQARQSGQSRQSEESRREGQESRAVSRGPERRELSRVGSNPFEMMRQMSREMDRMMSALAMGSPLFGSQFRPLLARGWDDEWATSRTWVPQIDVEQRGDAILVRADLPGVRKEDVQVEITEEGLMLSGERREEREEGAESQGYRAYERTYGRFYRTIPLPQKVNVDQLKAKMRDGVLEITIPLDESARARRIQIED
jgi:HSP20 family protein